MTYESVVQKDLNGSVIWHVCSFNIPLLCQYLTNKLHCITLMWEQYMLSSSVLNTLVSIIRQIVQTPIYIIF